MRTHYGLEDDNLDKYHSAGDKFYTAWCRLAKDCYGENNRFNNYNFKGYQVGEEFSRFSRFKIWMEKQNHEGHVFDCMLLTTSKTVSPDSSCFISKALARVLYKRRRKKTTLPEDVFLKGETYQVRSVNVLGVQRYVGSYGTLKEATTTAKFYKSNLIAQLAELEIDPRVRARLREMS